MCVYAPVYTFSSGHAIFSYGFCIEVLLSFFSYYRLTFPFEQAFKRPHEYAEHFSYMVCFFLTLRFYYSSVKNQDIYWLYREVKTIMLDEWINPEWVSVAEGTMK